MSEMLEVMVDGLWRQGDKSLAVSLVGKDAAPLPAWQPGAHIDLHLPCGKVRQYSLTGACDESRYLICVAREAASRGGSRYIHDTLRPGQTLMISPPRNLFPLRHAGRVLLLAAGIGITPLYAMALRLKASGTPFTLHYFVKRRSSAAFITELMDHGGEALCTVHCSDEGGSPRHRLAQTITASEGNAHLYACGPQGFMDAVAETARSAGWAAEQIHTEAFQPVAPQTNAARDGTFTVTLASSGKKWPVPGDKTIAQVLLENGVAVPLSCEMGLCGACLTPVLEGVIDHRDTVQTGQEKTAPAQHIALCCSRSHSGEIVIDL